MIFNSEVGVSPIYVTDQLRDFTRSVASSEQTSGPFFYQSFNQIIIKAPSSPNIQVSKNADNYQNVQMNSANDLKWSFNLHFDSGLAGMAADITGRRFPRSLWMKGSTAILKASYQAAAECLSCALLGGETFSCCFLQRTSFEV